MKELHFLEIIEDKLTNSSYIGDDCAFLDDLDIFVTHDTLVEDVHFSLYTIKPYLLGRKAVSVNLSDLAASIATPKYITVSVSVPKTTKDSFISELYRGINDVCNEYNIKVIGGDITGSDKVVISVSAIGKKKSLYMSSRSNAKKGDVILVTGEFGSSSAGFYALSNFLYAEDKLMNNHFNPTPRIQEALELASKINTDVVVMDCSDGLVDALYKVAQASQRSLKIDINRVPVAEELKTFCKRNNLSTKDFVKWGGEDYELLICTDEETYSLLDEKKFKLIGYVQNKDNSPVVEIEDGNEIETVSKAVFEEKTYNHF